MKQQKHESHRLIFVKQLKHSFLPNWDIYPFTERTRNREKKTKKEWLRVHIVGWMECLVLQWDLFCSYEWTSAGWWEQTSWKKRVNICSNRMTIFRSSVFHFLCEVHLTDNFDWSPLLEAVSRLDARAMYGRGCSTSCYDRDRWRLFKIKTMVWSVSMSGVHLFGFSLFLSFWVLVFQILDFYDFSFSVKPRFRRFLFLVFSFFKGERDNCFVQNPRRGWWIAEWIAHSAR